MHSHFSNHVQVGIIDLDCVLTARDFRSFGAICSPRDVVDVDLHALRSLCVPSSFFSRIFTRIGELLGECSFTQETSCQLLDIPTLLNTANRPYQKCSTEPTSIMSQMSSPRLKLSSLSIRATTSVRLDSFTLASRVYVLVPCNIQGVIGNTFHCQLRKSV